MRLQVRSRTVGDRLRHQGDHKLYIRRRRILSSRSIGLCLDSHYMFCFWRIRGLVQALEYVLMAQAVL
jgi:hypothetical protein